MSWQIRAAALEPIPGDIAATLEESIRGNAGRTMYLTGELLNLLKVFEAAGIRVIPFKGPLLAATLHGSLALRAFNDLDLFVRPEDVGPVKALLIGRGYRPHFDLTDAEEVAFQHYQHEHVFYRPDDGVVAEIQWQITERYRGFSLDVESAWRRLAPVVVAGQEILTFSPEDTLVILCSHGTRHAWFQLGLIHDVAQLVSVCPDMDQWEIAAWAQARGRGRMIRLRLELASDFLEDSRAAERRLVARRDRAIPALAAKVRAHLARETAPTLGFQEASCFGLRVKERLRDRIAYFFDLALTPTVGDWQFLPLPPHLSPLYRVVRLIRLLETYVSRRLGQLRPQQ